MKLWKENDAEVQDMEVELGEVFEDYMRFSANVQGWNPKYLQHWCEKNTTVAGKMNWVSIFVWTIYKLEKIEIAESSWKLVFQNLNLASFFLERHLAS